MKKIKKLLLDGQGWKQSSDEESITEIKVEGEMGYVRWYKQGDREYNGKYVIELQYENVDESE